MLILNTFTVLLQIALITLISVILTNFIRHIRSIGRNMAVLAPAVFVNHGGGPLPLLGDKDSEGLTIYLRDTLKNYVDFSNIKAIILVTAHWEEDIFTISSGKHHDLYFDYYGFPPESYKYKYNASGDPNLAVKIQGAMNSAGIKCKLDEKRGWDHGVFVPMMLINPSANIPIVQVSVLKNQNPEDHYKIGQVLYGFRRDNVAIIGSGMSYHNMREFRTNRNGKGVVNEDFDNYLNRVLTSDNEQDRKEGLVAWQKQKGALEAHPLHLAEHFMPLIVIAGAGGPTPGKRIFNWDLSGKFRLSSFIWMN